MNIESFRNKNILSNCGKELELKLYRSFIVQQNICSHLVGLARPQPDNCLDYCGSIQPDNPVVYLKIFIGIFLCVNSVLYLPAPSCALQIVRMGSNRVTTEGDLGTQSIRQTNQTRLERLYEYVELGSKRYPKKTLVRQPASFVIVAETSELVVSAKGL